MLVYPQRLVIYHAGAGKTAFLACLKVTTILSLTFFGFVVTPAYLASGEPLWKAAGGEFTRRVCLQVLGPQGFVQDASGESPAFMSCTANS